MLAGILCSQLGLLSCSSFYVLWFFMVLSTLCTCGWLKSFLPPSSLVLYFLVSALGTLIFFIRPCVPLLFNSILVLGLFLILGLAPFQFWVLPVLIHFPLPSLIAFLGPLKLGYLFILVGASSASLCLPFFSFLVGRIFLFTTTSPAMILYSSSAMQLLPLFLLGPLAFWSFHLTYLLSTSTFLFFFIGVATPLFCFFCLIGLPPLGMFWAKLHALSLLPSYQGFLLISVSSLLIFPYVRASLSIQSKGYTSLLLASVLVCLPAAMSA